MKEMLLEKLELLGWDVDYEDYTDTKDNYISVVFDDDNRDYINEKEVEELENFFEKNCLSKEGDFYIIYHFEDFDVEVGYTSYDI